MKNRAHNLPTCCTLVLKKPPDPPWPHHLMTKNSPSLQKDTDMQLHEPPANTIAHAYCLMDGTGKGRPSPRTCTDRSPVGPEAVAVEERRGHFSSASTEAGPMHHVMAVELQAYKRQICH